jgi:hypothetical protein
VRKRHERSYLSRSCRLLSTWLNKYGVFHTAQPLRPDYTRLKQRLIGEVPQRESARPAFVELVRPQPAEMDGCIIEFESAQGAKMRVQWRLSVIKTSSGGASLV